MGWFAEELSAQVENDVSVAGTRSVPQVKWSSVKGGVNRCNAGCYSLKTMGVEGGRMAE